MVNQSINGMYNVCQMEEMVFMKGGFRHLEAGELVSSSLELSPTSRTPLRHAMVDIAT